MLNQKNASYICLGLFVFAFILENLINEHKSIQHEPVKTQVSYFYNLTPTVSGTVSTTAGPVNLIKLV